MKKKLRKEEKGQQEHKMPHAKRAVSARSISYSHRIQKRAAHSGCNAGSPTQTQASIADIKTSFIIAPKIPFKRWARLKICNIF